jgi:hypothetical protein
MVDAAERFPMRPVLSIQVTHPSLTQVAEQSTRSAAVPRENSSDTAPGKHQLKVPLTRASNNRPD